MVHYIGKENQENLGWKKYLLIGGVGLTLVAGAVKGIFSCAGSKEPNPVKTEIVEKNVDSVLEELANNPESLKQSYGKLAAVVEQGLSQNPDYANRFVRSGLESLEKNNADIEQSTYIAMFQRIREKAEQKPELMEHFGEKAKSYMEKKFVENYSAIIEQSFKESADSLKEKGKPLLDALGVAKDYVIQKIREE